MGITQFPHGVLATPSIGAGLGFGWKTDSTSYFVDGEDGDDDNAGTSPELAFLTVEAGIAAITKYDVLYIMEKGFSGTDPLTYAGADANHTIAVADTGVAIVGVSHAGIIGYPMTPYLAGRAATETPIFTVNAPLVAIENLHFMGGWANAYTTTAGIYAPNSTGTSSAVPQALSIFNCSFEDLEGATPTSSTTAPGGGISIAGTWYTVINHCRFRNCVTGIQLISAASTSVANTFEHCVFYADNDTDVNVDIKTYMQGTSDFLINDMYFAHVLPAYASGDTLKYVSCVGSEEGMITNCHLGHSATLTAGIAGTGITAPSPVGFAHNYCFHALMVDQT